MKRLLMTVGLPRSGKSTWAKSEGFPVVCPDAIRIALHGQVYAQSAEPFVWAIARTMVKALFGAGHDRVILDACNNTKKRREEWRSRGWVRVFHAFPAGAAECKDRALEDGRAELLGVIERMADQHEPVGEDEKDANPVP